MLSHLDENVQSLDEAGAVRRHDMEVLGERGYDPVFGVLPNGLDETLARHSRPGGSMA